MASLEKDNKMKIRTLRRALEYISNDVELWKAAIELEEPEEAKSLLYKAIEWVPYNTSIWIALAKLENYQNARKVLNNAWKKIPTDHTIWVHAAKLEEAEGNFELVPKLLRKGIKNLEKNVKITREQWLKEAYDAEMSASIVTAKAIIHETKNIGIDDIEDAEENKRIWLETGENFLDKGAIEWSRAMIEWAWKVMPKDPSVWLKAIDLEKKYGNNSTLGAILKQALEAWDDIELFFLMNAKHLWKQEKKIEEAIKTLQDGLHNLENEEELYLALVKLYREKRMYDEARQLLIKGRQKWDSNRIWMQSAQIEREVGNPDQAKLIIKTAIEKYPTFYKLYLIY